MTIRYCKSIQYKEIIFKAGLQALCRLIILYRKPGRQSLVGPEKKTKSCQIILTALVPPLINTHYDEKPVGGQGQVIPVDDIC